MQQFMALYPAKTQESIQVLTIALLVILILINLNVLLHSCFVNCKTSRRLKKQQKEYRGIKAAKARRKEIKR